MSFEEWRLLRNDYRNPLFNLALEEALLRLTEDAAAKGTIRLWTSPNSVVIGRFQRTELEVNLRACERHSTQIVRRLTGGGAVYHDTGNLNFSVFLPNSHRLAQGGIMGIFHLVGSSVLDGLEELGLHAELGLPNMIKADGRKISGLAAALKWGAILVHGTLLVRTNLEILGEVLDPPSVNDILVCPNPRSLKVSTMNLQDKVGNISMNELSQILGKSFENVFAIRLRKGEFTHDENWLAWKLYREKYSKSEWNLGGDAGKTQQFPSMSRQRCPE